MYWLVMGIYLLQDQKIKPSKPIKMEVKSSLLYKVIQGSLYIRTVDYV